MSDFVIYTDSACDIPPETLEEWGVGYRWLTYTFDGEDVFICHGYSATRGGAAMLIQRPISWTADGWPELR